MARQKRTPAARELSERIVEARKLLVFVRNIAEYDYVREAYRESGRDPIKEANSYLKDAKNLIVACLGLTDHIEGKS